MSSTDLNDNRIIPYDEVGLFNGVPISVPEIHVSLDEENGNDRATANIRMIHTQDLRTLLELAMYFTETKVENQQEYMDVQRKAWREMISILVSDSGHNPTYNRSTLMEFVDMCITFTKHINIDDLYLNTTNIGLGFERIRRYTNNKNTKLLETVEPAVYNGCHFYAQLEPKQVEEARRVNNDSDVNRMYFCLREFEKTLLFREGYALCTTLQMINMGMFRLCLVFKSYPIEGQSSTDLRSNALGWIGDLVIRSRLFTYWQRYPVCQSMLVNLRNSYPVDNPLVALSKIKIARDRAQYILSLVKRSNSEFMHLFNDLSYDDYEKVIESARITVTPGQEYLVFGIQFITAFLSSNISKVVERALSRKNDILDMLHSQQLY